MGAALNPNDFSGRSNCPLLSTMGTLRGAAYRFKPVMQFFRAKTWIFAAFFALLSSFSPLAARVCIGNEIAPMCAQNVPQCAMPCGDCCREAAPNVGILGSVAAPLPPQRASIPTALADFASDSALSEANFASPVFFAAPTTRIAHIAGEVDPPPPRRIFGSAFSCRAPPAPC